MQDSSLEVVKLDFMIVITKVIVYNVFIRVRPSCLIYDYTTTNK